MRYQGRVTDWRDEKGFGFITPNGGGERVFFHIKALPRSSRRPSNEDRVNYTLQSYEPGRHRAATVEYVVRPKVSSPARSVKPAMLILVAAFAAALTVLAALGRLPSLVGAVYVMASVVTFGAYAIDKAAARADRWRTQESTLHLLGLVGGWPGGLVAQQVLRHKSSKPSFIAVFWITVAANLCVLLWLVSASGQAFVGVVARGLG